jgi:hypothetical protein
VTKKITQIKGAAPIRLHNPFIVKNISLNDLKKAEYAV